MRHVVSLLVFAVLLPMGIRSASADCPPDDYTASVEEFILTTVIQNRRPAAMGMSDGRFVADGNRLYVWLDVYVEESEYMDVVVNMENVDTGEFLTMAVPGPDSEFGWGAYSVWVELELTPDRVGHWKVSALADGYAEEHTRTSFVVTALPVETPTEASSEETEETVDVVDESSLWVQFLRS